MIEIDRDRLSHAVATEDDPSVLIVPAACHESPPTDNVPFTTRVAGSLSHLIQKLLIVIGEHGNELIDGLHAIARVKHERSGEGRSSFKLHTSEGIPVIPIAGSLRSIGVADTEGWEETHSSISTRFPAPISVSYLEVPDATSSNAIVARYHNLPGHSSPLSCARFTDTNMATCYSPSKYFIQPSAYSYEEARAQMISGYTVGETGIISLHTTTDERSEAAIVKGGLNAYTLEVIAATSFEKVVIDSGYPPDGFWGRQYRDANDSLSNILELQEKSIGLEYFVGDTEGIARDILRLMEGEIHPRMIELHRATSIVFCGLFSEGELRSFVPFSGEQLKTINKAAYKNIVGILSEMKKELMNEPKFPLADWCQPSKEAQHEKVLLSYREVARVEDYLSEMRDFGPERTERLKKLWNGRQNVIVDEGDLPLFCQEVSFVKYGLDFLLVRKQETIVEVKQDGSVEVRATPS